jgi:hypothetical protein
MEAELKAAYTKLEDAIREVSAREGSEGVLTEWVLITCHHRYDDDGDGVTHYGMLLPDGGGQVPHHRILGLLDFQLARLRAEVVEP